MIETGKTIVKRYLSIIMAIVLTLPMIAVSSTEVAAAGFITTPMISAGRDHTAALRYDGTVWVWGQNWAGHLGDGTTAIRTTPVQLNGITNAIAVSAGGEHTIALRSDGTVWAWGNNANGQLGDGSTTRRLTPTQVSGLSNVTAISAGWRHSAALRSDGTVWVWGMNNGTPTAEGRTYSPTPVQVNGLTNVTAISAGFQHTIALRRDGTVWAWGVGNNGQLGDGSAAHSLDPVQASGLANITAISAGAGHSTALRNDGTVWAWGMNRAGQLGDGTTNSRHTPVQVNGLTNVTAISAGGTNSGEPHTMALRSDGTVWAWGSNWNGRLGLGDGTTTDRHIPVQVNGLTNMTGISAGGSHTIALRGDGYVWGWGHNGGSLGINNTANQRTPVQVLGPDGMGYLNLNRPTPTPAPEPMPTPTPVPVPIVSEVPLNFLQAAASFIMDNGWRLYRPIIDGQIYYVYEIRNGIVRQTERSFTIERWPAYWDSNTVYLIEIDEDGRYSLVLDFTTLQKAGFLHETSLTVQGDTGTGGGYSPADLMAFIRDILFNAQGTDAHTLIEQAWSNYYLGNLFVDAGNIIAGLGQMVVGVMTGDVTAPISFLLPIIADAAYAQMDITAQTTELLREIRRELALALHYELHEANRIVQPANLENGFIRNYRDAVTLRTTRHSRAVYMEYARMEARYLHNALGAAMTNAWLSIPDVFIGFVDFGSGAGNIVDATITFSPIARDGIVVHMANIQTLRDPELLRMLQNIDNAFEMHMAALHNPFAAMLFSNFELFFGEHYDDLYAGWIFTNYREFYAFYENLSQMLLSVPLSTANNWARESISRAFDYGLIPQPSLQCNFTNNVTRAEFAALAVALYETATGREITGRMHFNDTNDINVQKMGYLGVVTGIGSGNFGPNNIITREQAAVMLAGLADVIGQPLPPASPTFADNAQISSWAVDAVGRVQAAGIMGGIGNNQFAPQGGYTREQSIITILRLFDTFR